MIKNEHFTALVPFWAVWPYEAMIVPRRPMRDLTELSEEEVAAFAAIFRALTIRFDNIFQTSFPYSMGIHQRPTDGQEHPEWHWHMSFYPPLLRSGHCQEIYGRLRDVCRTPARYYRRSRRADAPGVGEGYYKRE